jgi:hypothetical protein
MFLYCIKLPSGLPVITYIGMRQHFENVELLLGRWEMLAKVEMKPGGVNRFLSCVVELEALFCRSTAPGPLAWQQEAGLGHSELSRIIPST